ncbi:MAG: methyltransferase domain-containing protein [bacterium]|nr:methyltransferase domain-containing protein [bacterium]MCY3632631.1 methyltransferase domain-containing protein [bacterium]
MLESHQPRPITVIGESLPYEDGAEAELLEVLRAAEDRRVGSDELASAVRDWPTAYHLSPERAMLLAPLGIAPGDRVLDVGAGSGVNTRICADRGSTVTAVEGSAARAELIAHRCAGLEGVEVLCGRLEDLGEDRRSAYDVALVVGALEYAGTGQGGGGGAAVLLSQVADALAPNGILVLAIENRLGLKYLLGYPEDHLGLPWVGWEGYQEGEPNTWSRKELGRMLIDVGLTSQKWLYPFPDYKLPTAVLSERLYSRVDAADLVDQIVGFPVADVYSRPVLVADDRAAHRTMIDAGLGPEVANSFLIVAGRTPGALVGRVDEQALAWRSAPDRRQRWTQRAIVVDSAVSGGRGDEGMAIRRCQAAHGRDGDFEGWLGQAEVAEDCYHQGRNLEQCLLDSVRAGCMDEVAELLRDWRAVIAAQEVPVTAVPNPHPYLPEDTVRVLPPDWLDVAPDNFVVTANGLVLVDREWMAMGGVDARLAVVRGLWKTVSAMLRARCHIPVPVTWSNDRLVRHLGGMIGEDIDSELLQRWRDAEADLVARVYRQPAVRLAELYDAGGRSRMEQLSSPLAPYRRMEQEVQQLRALVAERSDSHEVAALLQEAKSNLARIRGELAQSEGERVRIQAELAEARARLARVAWRERLHNAVAHIVRRLKK